MFQRSIRDMQDSSERVARESTRFARGAVSGATELWLGSARLLGDLALNWNDSVNRARSRANEEGDEKNKSTEPMRQFIELTGDITRDCSRTAGDMSKVFQASVDAFTSVVNEGEQQQSASSSGSAKKGPTPPKV